MAIVYTHTRNDNNQVFYVGVGKHSRRAYTKFSRNSHWYNVVNKHGYTVQITHRDVCYEEALSIERYLVSFYGRRDLNAGSLVNLTDGGDGVENPSVRLVGEKHPMYGKRHTKETRAKMSKAQKNRPKCSEKTLEIKRANMLGENNPMYGRRGILSPVYGKPKSEEHKAKLSESKIGKKNPWMSGENSPNYGKVGGKNAAAKAVIDDMSGKVYECALYAAIDLGMAPTTLRGMLNGHKKNKTMLRYL